MQRTDAPVTDLFDLQLLTVEQVATLCQISIKTVYRAIERGSLGASRLGIGGAYRIKLEDVEAWIETSTVRACRRDKQPPPAATSRRSKRRSPRMGSEGRLLVPEKMDGRP